MDTGQLKKSIISAYLVFALVVAAFIGFLVFEGVVEKGNVKAATIIVDDKGGGNYTTINAAIVNANPGDTIYVWNGIYNENVNINKKVTLIGNGTANTTINGGGSGNCIYINADWVNVTGFNITNSGVVTTPISNLDAGIQVRDSQNVHIYNNALSGMGLNIIYLRNSYYCTIDNNTVISNSSTGNIYLRSSNNNLVINNSCINNTNYYGINLESSSSNKIMNNNCSANKHGIYTDSGPNSIIQNTCNLNIIIGIFIEGSSNYISNNNCSFNYNTGIRVYSVKNTINNNTCNFNGYSGMVIGRPLIYVDNNTVYNNTCSNNKNHGIMSINAKDSQYLNNFVNSNGIHGFHFQNCQRNIFFKNTLTSNLETGIWLYGLSGSSALLNNTIISSQNGIMVSWSAVPSSITINNNSMYDCGLVIGGTGLDYDLYNIDGNLVNNKPVYFMNRKSGVIVPPGAGQIILANCDNIIIENQNCSDGSIGVHLEDSNNVTIRDNKFNSNFEWGIIVRNSVFNTIKNNTCNSNDKYGIGVWDRNNIIDNNTCNNNQNIQFDSGIGIAIEASNNTISNNTCNSNREYGISLFTDADSNYITNNICNNNEIGIRLLGIYVPPFFIGLTEFNIIKNNNLSYNEHGIMLLRSRQNTIYENIISSNNVSGLFIDTQSKNNFFYHNMIISNRKQVNNSGLNYWNNSEQEGNYWSDYSGLDNGAGGRPLGDGIGDTNIPHLGLDNYPFVQQNGWVTAPVPLMHDPGNIDTNGSLTVTCGSNPKLTGYIFEMDTTTSFISPVQLFNGPTPMATVGPLDNGTYYFRVKGYNDYAQSGWSNLVDIIVDWSPAAPMNLTAKNPTGNNITISWEANIESDLVGYHVLMNDSGIGGLGVFHQIDTIPETAVQYEITDLDEEITYSFVINAFDPYSNSSFSNIASNTTLDLTAPPAPTGLNATAVSKTQIDLSWNVSYTTDLAGYLVFKNDTGSGPGGSFHIINQTVWPKFSYSVTGLAEKTTYHFKLKVFDEVPNNSSFSDVVSATTFGDTIPPDQTPPSAPASLMIIDRSYNYITLSWTPNVELDVIGYFVYRSTSQNGTFTNLTSGPFTETEYNDSGLDELTTYYYKIKAVDGLNITSIFSELVYGTTLSKDNPGESPPVIGIAQEDFSIAEDSYDDTSIKLNEWFIDPNQGKLNFTVTGQQNIKVTIYQDNGTVVLAPDQNWNGKETLTFYAEKGSQKISDDVIITVLFINDPPHSAKITITSGKNEIQKGETITLEGDCEDPDLLYGDELTYTWNSSIDGQLTDKKALAISTLSVGVHIITLAVNDKAGKTTEVSVEITVTDIEDITPTVGKTKDDNNMLMMAGIGIAIVIVVMVILLLVMRKRKKEPEVEEQSIVEQPQPPAQPPVDPGQEFQEQLPPEQYPVQDDGSTSLEMAREPGQIPMITGSVPTPEELDSVDLASLPVTSPIE